MKHYLCTTLFFAVGVIAPLICAGEAGAMGVKAGVASVPLSIPEGISIAALPARHRPFGERGTPIAYNFKPSKGKLDELRAKAIVLQFGQQKIALVSVDLVAIPPSMPKLVAPHLKDIGLDENNLFISATHTHAGPGGYVESPFWETFAVDRFNPTILQLFVTDIEKAIRAANNKLVTAKLAIGTMDLSDQVVNRRGGKETDAQLTLVRIDSSADKPMANIINFGIHGTLLDEKNFMLSGDVPGSIERQFEKLTGAPGFLFQSDEGDVAPNSEDHTYVGVNKIGGSIALQVSALWKSLVPTTDHDYVLVSVPLKLGKAHFNILGCLSSKPRKDSLTGRLFVPVSLGLPERVDISGFKIDKHAFIFVPGEPIAELGKLIKSAGIKKGFETVSIISLTNHYLGYILTSFEFLRGGYESCVSFYGPLMGHKLEGASDSVFSALNNQAFKGH